MNGINWTAVGGAFVAGIGVGGLVVRTWLEKDLRENAPEKIVYVNTVTNHATLATEVTEPLPEIDDHLKKIMGTPIAEIKEAVVPEHLPSPPNPYHKTVEATATSHEMFVEGGVNDYGVSYIEEEDYLDDDGRFKGKIDIMMDDQTPVFLMDGTPIDDWDKRVGDSILVDFYKLVPPGIDPVLYVRNHRTDEDYEVVLVSQ